MDDEAPIVRKTSQFKPVKKEEPVVSKQEPKTEIRDRKKKVQI